MLKKSLSLLIALTMCVLMIAVSFAEGTLPDGTYTPDGFTWSGGSGKLKGIECPSVTVRGGEAFAEIVILSNKYTYIKADGTQYDCEHTDTQSSAEIPVQLNADNTILACTTAMSTPHEIEYHIFIELDAAQSEDGDTLTLADTVFTRDAQTGTGLLSVYRSDAGCLIKVQDAGSFFVPADADHIPKGISDAATVIACPENVYIEADTAVREACFTNAENFRMVSDAAGQADGLEDRIASGRTAVVSTDGQTDYKALLTGNCDLAILPYSAYDSDDAEYLKMLGIPVFFDRSGDEPDAAGIQAWNAVYDILLGIEGDLQ